MMPLEIRKICKRYGEKQVLRGVSHVFPQRGASLVSGPSGCGKTTLLRILLSLETADSGEVNMPSGAKIAAVFQEDRLIMHMSALGNLALACPERTQEEMISVLSSLGLDGRSPAPVREYSGGMRRRVAIARAVLAKPDILFLDEPFTGLDEQTREHAAKIVRRELSGGLIVVVTHDMDEAALLGCSDRLSLGEG